MIQKATAPQDQRIMILLGSGHVSMFKKFIDDEQIFKVVELKDLLEKKIYISPWIMAGTNFCLPVHYALNSREKLHLIILGVVLMNS